MRKMFAALGLLIGLETPCLAWEADGFRSGMIVSEVEAQLENLGEKWTKDTASGLFQFLWTSISTGDTFRRFEFCEGKLYKYEFMPRTKDRADAFRIFVAIADREVTRRGRPIFEPRPETKVRLGTEIVLDWTVEGERFQLAFTDHGKNGASVDRMYDNVNKHMDYCGRKDWESFLDRKK